MLQINKRKFVNERRIEEFIKGWNMLGRRANDPEFVAITQTLGEALEQWPRSRQYRFINITESQSEEHLRFFAEQCGRYCTEEMKDRLLSINYLIFNLSVHRIHRILRCALREGALAPE